MDYSAGSEWNNNGSESGWTCYLQESYHNVYNERRCSINMNGYESNSTSRNRCYDDDESEVDMSMVSDASSGPPQFLEDGGCNYRNVVMKSGREKKSKNVSQEKKMKKNNNGKYQEYECNYGDYDAHNSVTNLDDTASSPVITYSKIQGDSTFNSQRTCWQYSHPRADFAEPSHLRGRRFKD